MSFSWFVARRYLTARRKQAFISLISLVSILGVGVGVAAMVIALALMTGLQGELRDRIVGSTAHIYVYKVGNTFADFDREAPSMAIDGVVASAPALVGKAVAESTRGAQAFVTVKGVDVVREAQVTELATAMIAGRLDDLRNRPEGAVQPIVIGADLALSLHASVGDTIKMLTLNGPTTPFGRQAGSSRFEVVGIFRFGFFEIDSQYGLVTLARAQSFFRSEGMFDFIELRVRQLDEAPRIRRALEQRLGPAYSVRDWTQLNQSLYSALWLEKVAITLTIGLIVMVAALNIVASLVLLVMEKSRDIAILRTMGASARSIRLIFMLQGLVIGCVGTAGGTLLGLSACRVLDRYRLIQLPSDVYQITYLPFRVLPLDLLIVVGGAIVVCFLATIYPSRQAGRLDPAEALRYQ
jgi:lipoprotein-releasing system permease protein